MIYVKYRDGNGADFSADFFEMRDPDYVMLKKREGESTTLVAIVFSAEVRSVEVSPDPVAEHVS